MNTASAISHQASTIEPVQLQGRARALRLMGLLAHWPSVQGEPARLGWTSALLGWEESERSRRSLRRRLRSTVFEILAELRERLWALYGPQIQHATREDQRTTSPKSHGAIDQRDLPF